MYFLLKMVIFQCSEGSISWNPDTQMDSYSDSSSKIVATENTGPCAPNFGN